MLDEFDLAEIYELLNEYKLMVEDRMEQSGNSWYAKVLKDKKERIDIAINRVYNARNK